MQLNHIKSRAIIYSGIILFFFVIFIFFPKNFTVLNNNGTCYGYIHYENVGYKSQVCYGFCQNCNQISKSELSKQIQYYKAKINKWFNIHPSEEGGACYSSEYCKKIFCLNTGKPICRNYKCKCWYVTDADVNDVVEIHLPL